MWVNHNVSEKINNQRENRAIPQIFLLIGYRIYMNKKKNCFDTKYLHSTHLNY